MGGSQGFDSDAPMAVPRDSYSRREALRWAGGAAAAAALGPALLASGCASTASKAAGEVDVAIIGASLSNP